MNGDKDWIWKTILAVAFVGIVYGVGSNHGPASLDKVMTAVSKVWTHRK